MFSKTPIQNECFKENGAFSLILRWAGKIIIFLLLHKIMLIITILKFQWLFVLWNKCNENVIVLPPKKMDNFTSENFMLNRNVPEAVTRSCSIKKVFLEISQNSQENNCARVHEYLLQKNSINRYLVLTQ